MIDSILNLYARNLDFAHRLVADLPDEKMAVQPAAKMNHAAWVIGHLAWAADDIAGKRQFGLERIMPAKFDGAFDHKSAPTDNRTVYPDKVTLVKYLDDSHERVAAALKARGDSFLVQPTTDPIFAKRFPQMGGTLLHLMIGHEQMHLGQLSAWRRAQGLPAV